MQPSPSRHDCSCYTAAIPPGRDEGVRRRIDRRVGRLGRRTPSSWRQAAGVGKQFRSYYYFLDCVGRNAIGLVAGLLRIALDRIEPSDRLLFALDDTPTKRYGPKIQ